MSRLRWRTVAMSMATGPVTVPNCAAWRASCATLALQISFLLGRQLMLGQEPPIQRRSTTALRRPARAMCQARYMPPFPPPRMRISNRSGCAMMISLWGFHDSLRGRQTRRSVDSVGVVRSSFRGGGRRAPFAAEDAALVVLMMQLGAAHPSAASQTEIDLRPEHHPEDRSGEVDPEPLEAASSRGRSERARRVH